MQCLYKVSEQETIERNFSEVDAPWYTRMLVLFLFDWFGSTRWLNQISKKQAIDHCIQLSLSHIKSFLNAKYEQTHDYERKVYQLLLEFQRNFSKHTFMKSFATAFLLSDSFHPVCEYSLKILSDQVDKTTLCTFYQKNPDFCNRVTNRGFLVLTAELINKGDIPNNLSSVITKALESRNPPVDVREHLAKFINDLSSPPQYIYQQLIPVFLEKNEDHLLDLVFKKNPSLNKTFPIRINGEAHRHNILSLCIIFKKWHLVEKIIHHCDQSAIIQFPHEGALISIPIFLLYAGRFESSRFNQTTHQKLKQFILENKDQFINSPLNLGDTYVIQFEQKQLIIYKKTSKLYPLCCDGLYDVATRYLKFDSSVLFESSNHIPKFIFKRTTKNLKLVFNGRSTLEIILQIIYYALSEKNMNDAKELVNCIFSIANNLQYKPTIHDLHFILGLYISQFDLSQSPLIFVSEQLEYTLFKNSAKTAPLCSDRTLWGVDSLISKIKSSPYMQHIVASHAPRVAAFYDLNPYLALQSCDITQYERQLQKSIDYSDIQSIASFPKFLVHMKSSELIDTAQQDTLSKSCLKNHLNSPYNLVLYQALRCNKDQIRSNINQIILSDNHGLSDTMITNLLCLPEIDLSGFHIHYYHNLSLYCQNQQIGRHIHSFLFKERSPNHDIIHAFYSDKNIDKVQSPNGNQLVVRSGR